MVYVMKPLLMLETKRAGWALEPDWSVQHSSFDGEQSTPDDIAPDEMRSCSLPKTNGFTRTVTKLHRTVGFLTRSPVECGEAVHSQSHV